MPVAAWLGALLALLATIHTAVAQVPAPLPQPDVPLYLGGNVLAVVAQADGSLVFGGTFSSVNGVARSNIARLRADGSLDPDWNPAANGSVRALALAADGSIYVGGDFSTIGGQSRNHVARLAAGGSGAADSAWNPNANASVAALANAADGGIYVGGDFSQIGGAARNRIAKLAASAAGSADAGFNPSADGTVAAIAVAADGTVFAGGSFANIGGRARAFVAKLAAANGGADATWNAAADGAVQTLALEASGRLYVGGAFAAIGGQPLANLARVATTGSGLADAAWQPDPDQTVAALLFDGGGGLFAGGAFTTIGGRFQRFLARLSTQDGSADQNWTAAPDSNVQALAFAHDALYVGGDFSHIDDQLHLALAAIAADGSVAAAPIDAEQPGYAFAFVEQQGGGTIVGGQFEKAGQAVRRNILRIQPDGALDADWNPSANSYVLALAVDADDSVYAGGYFTTIGGVLRPSVAKFAADGSLDPIWNPSADEIVRALVVAADGSVYAGGRFSAIGGLARSRIAKLAGDGDGAADPSWDADADDNVVALAIDAGGNLYAGGDFSQIGTRARSRIAKLGAGGIADASWNPAADDTVASLAIASSGAVFAGGAFQTIGGQARGHLAKLAATGSGGADPSWNATANGVVAALAFGNDGNLYAGGMFSTIGGYARNSIAKLSANGSGAVDSLWNPGADGGVVALDVYINGAIFAGGEFATIGGAARLGLAALPPVTTPIATTTLAIGAIAPTTTVVGQPYSIAFTVSSSATTPSGSVMVRDDAGAVCGPVVLSGGAGSCSLASTAAGTRTLTASFTPADAGAYFSSRSSATHSVTRANTTLAITAHTPDPATPTQTVTVSVALAVANPGAGVPGGAITVGDGVGSCTIAEGSSACTLTLATRGPRTLTASYAGDANFNASAASTTHHVNRLPLPSNDSYAASEDAPLTIAAAQGVLANDSDPDGDTLSVVNAGTLTASGIGGVVHLFANGAFDYTPPANANGSASFSYSVGDGLETATGTVVLTVSAVNDPPSFSLAPSPIWPAGTAGARDLPGFATVTSFGPPDEAAQQVQAWLLRTIAAPAGVVSDVSVALDGSLHYVLGGAPGSASFGLRLQDNGGTANGGSDTSPEQVFTITIGAGADLSVTLDDGVDFVVGGAVVTYRAMVVNAGPSDVIAAHVVDMLPSNLAAASWTCTASGGATCSASGSGGIDDSVSIPNGGSLTYVLDATVVSPPEMRLINTISVTAPAAVPDIAPSNNSATDSDAVGLFADGFDV
ncbi:MAG: cadherin-like domain-containing protein [Dokdonella sp.]